MSEAVREALADVRDAPGVLLNLPYLAIAVTVAGLRSSPGYRFDAESDRAALGIASGWLFAATAVYAVPGVALALASERLSGAASFAAGAVGFTLAFAPPGAIAVLRPMYRDLRRRDLQNGGSVLQRDRSARRLTNRWAVSGWLLAALGGIIAQVFS